jgi:hypothetical protein
MIGSLEVRQHETSPAACSVCESQEYGDRDGDVDVAGLLEKRLRMLHAPARRNSSTCLPPASADTAAISTTRPPTTDVAQGNVSLALPCYEMLGLCDHFVEAYRLAYGTMERAIWKVA